MAGRLRERIGEERRYAERQVAEAAYDAMRAQQLRTQTGAARPDDGQRSRRARRRHR
jgi:hypothetical protein